MNNQVLGRTQVMSKVACSPLDLRRVPCLALHRSFQVSANDGSKPRWSCTWTPCSSAAGYTSDRRSSCQALRQQWRPALLRRNSSVARKKVPAVNATPPPGSNTSIDSSSDDDHGGGTQGWEHKVVQYGEFVSLGFPVWVALASVVALVRPQALAWVDSRVQFFGIVLTMLGMGMTLSFKDFEGALTMPKQLVAGVVLQYTVMPAAGVVMARLLHLPAHYAAGLVLVACCPGGTASNIVTYLARGNVALSVLMTAASTFLAVVMTPTLTARLVGQNVAVDAGALFRSTIQVVLLPVLAGVVLNQFLPKLVRKVSLFAPPVAVVTVTLVCAGVIGQCSQAILTSGGQVLVAAASLHALGFLGGYLLSHVLQFDEATARTISIEVGMQNSVLGVVLAGKHFTNPLTAVPCAVSSVCHSILGSVLAGLWRLRPTRQQPLLQSQQTT